MAAVTAASLPGVPPTAVSPDHLTRKPLPLPMQSTSPESADWSEEAKPLPAMPTPAESPRLRQPPISPVRVNFQPENWAQPTNVSIESSSAYATSSRLESPTTDRDLLQTHPAQHNPTLSVIPPQPNLRSMPDQKQIPNGRSENQTVPRRVPVPTSGQSASASSPESLAVPVGKLDLGLTNGTATPDSDGASVSDAALTGPNGTCRHSHETDSTGQQQVSAESSASNSASSNSGPIEAFESAESSLVDGVSGSQSVPQLQYHHQAFLPHSPNAAAITQESQQTDSRSSSNPDLAAGSGSPSAINRHLTPNSYGIRRSSLPRPQSVYSVYSDLGSRGRSPGLMGGSNMRAPSAQSHRSPDTRPSSYADMLNVPYPQPAPAPISLNNTQLRNAVGSNASLLSTQKTLEMYRQNVKKTTDMSIQYSFAVFLISTAQEQGLSYDESSRRKNDPKKVHDLESPYVDTTGATPMELVREARSILQRLSNAGYPFAQYYLADGYASGLFSKGKEDYNAAFPLFVLAAKHGHAESAYRTALCYEFGWGCRKDPAKAVQFLRTAAAKRHPGAMTRLGKACLSGDLGEKRYREGLKWLKLATESADAIYNAAPYQLGCLYETGYGDDIFRDENYAAELFTQAAELGNADANYRMGDAYEHGKLNCPRDPALSVHFYTGAAERGHPAAMMGLCAWYMVGAEPLLEKDEEEAYEWARRSAELGYVKAQYAVGYFTEMGIGCRRDILEANVWYVKAADGGDDRAKQRLAAIRTAVSGGTPMEVGLPRNGKMKKTTSKDECVVM